METYTDTTRSYARLILLALLVVQLLIVFLISTPRANAATPSSSSEAFRIFSEIFGHEKVMQAWNTIFGSAPATELVSQVSGSVPGGGIASDSFENGFLPGLWLDSSSVAISGDRAFTGSKSVKFSYGAGANTMSELRFDLGKLYQEVWISFKLYVPENYSHASISPSNNKFFRLWPNDYNDCEKVGASTWAQGGSSVLIADWSSKCEGVGSHGTEVPGFIGASDKGKWMDVKIQVVAATNTTKGTIRIWKNGVLVVNNVNSVDNYANGEAHAYRYGYLLGWANGGFTQKTDFYIDDVVFRTSDSGQGQSTTPSSLPEVSFSSSMNNIISGQSVNLLWSSKNSTTCSGTNFSTGGASNGTLSVSPTVSTTYTIVCTGSAGKVEKDVTIAVTAQNSTKFKIGDRIQVSDSSVNVRNSANGALLGAQVLGNLGTVLGGPVMASGYTWWNIDFQTGADGWSVEHYLEKNVLTKMDVTAPTIPDGLQVSAETASSVRLSWKPSIDPVVDGQDRSEAIEYTVYRCTGLSCTPATPITSLSKTLYTDADLSAGTTYRYRVLAKDAAGNMSDYSMIVSHTTPTKADATIPAKSPDTTPPSLSLILPANGATVSGTKVTVRASSSDSSTDGRMGSGIAGVQFKLDGVTLGMEDVTSPYSIVWDTTKFSNGNHTLTATARDGAGNITTSISRNVIVLNTSAAPTPIQSSDTVVPIVAYAFDDSVGMKASEYITGLDGTLNKGVQWVTGGKYGGAVLLDGKTGYITVPDNDSLDLTTGMTLSCWVYPFSQNGWRTAIIKEARGNLSYGLFTQNERGYPNVYVKGSHADAQVTLPKFTWSHLAATFDGASVRLYLNGSMVASVPAKTIVPSSGVLRIGGSEVWGEFFHGILDNVRVYNVSLSASQIVSDMNTPVSKSATSSEYATSTNPVLFEEKMSSIRKWDTVGADKYVDKYKTTRGMKPNYVARLRSNSGIEKVIPIENTNAISVSFKMGAKNLDTDDEYIEALYFNGVAWVTLARIKNGDLEEDGKLHPYSFDILGNMIDLKTFSLRFILSGNTALDYGYVDDVVVRVKS